MIPDNRVIWCIEKKYIYLLSALSNMERKIKHDMQGKVGKYKGTFQKSLL